MQQGAQGKPVQVQIYGDNYYIKGSNDSSYIIKVADYVDKKMNMIGQRNPHLSLKQVAVLASLNIADELYKLQNDYDKLLQILEEGKKG
ncbi:MAG: cell division protein ZapA [Bacillota bacterium]